jgi:hypothetical protein
MWHKVRESLQGYEHYIFSRALSTGLVLIHFQLIQIGPQQLWVVNRDLGDSSSAHTSDLEEANDMDDATSWETGVSDEDEVRGTQISLVPVLGPLDEKMLPA